MLGANQLDFISYTGAFKSNYRKGVHKLESILANPTHAAEFAANLGGVSVVLGVPIGREDRNSEALLSLLLNSDIADDAVLTWVHQFYEFTTWDDLMGNSARVQEMMNNPLLWRALGGSKKAVGKGVATLAGLSCVSYADIDAVVASSTAMAAVATSQTAMAAVATSQTAMTAVATSQTAMAAVAASQTAMTAVAASQTAMTAVAASTTAMTAVEGSNAAVTALGNSPLKVTDSGGYGNTSNKRTVRSGKAFVLSVTFGQTSNTGYYGNLSTFMLGSSPYRATCTATPRAVNRFAKEIVCYGEFQSLNDNVNYSKVVYIPC